MTCHCVDLPESARVSRSNRTRSSSSARVARRAAAGMPPAPPAGPHLHSSCSLSSMQVAANATDRTRMPRARALARSGGPRPVFEFGPGPGHGDGPGPEQRQTFCIVWILSFCPPAIVASLQRNASMPLCVIYSILARPESFWPGLRVTVQKASHLQAFRSDSESAGAHSASLDELRDVTESRPARLS